MRPYITLEKTRWKIDFEKAYNKVRWNFLQQTLRIKGFSYVWCKWIEAFTKGGNVGIKVNGQIGSYFQTKKGFDKVIHYRHYYLL